MEFYFLIVLCFFTFFPVKAKWFCLILIGMLTYQGIFTPGAAGAWGHLGAMASGFGFMFFASRNSLSLPSFGQKKRPKSKANLRIVKDDDEEGPKHGIKGKYFAIFYLSC